MLLVAPSNADIYSDVLRQKIAKFGYEKPTVLENKFDPDLAEIWQHLGVRSNVFWRILFLLLKVIDHDRIEFVTKLDIPRLSLWRL